MLYLHQNPLLRMKKFLIIYAVMATLLLTIVAILLYRTHHETLRLRNNNEVLAGKARLYETRLGDSAASARALQLELEEFRKQHARDTKQIRALKVRLRDVESLATSALEGEVEVRAPIHDTIVITKNLIDTLSEFHWSDSWVSINGLIGEEKVECEIKSIDTLRQVVHRVPRRFLFVRCGTKAIRQEIVSSNPHTRIVYAEYIEFPKRRRKR